MSSQEIKGVVKNNAPNTTIEFIKNHKFETALTIVAIAAITTVGTALALSAASTGALFPAQTFLYSSAGIAAGAIVAGFVIEGVKLWNKFKQEDKPKDLINNIAKLTQKVNDEVNLKGDSIPESQKKQTRKELIENLRSLRALILNNEITLEKAEELIKSELKDKGISLEVNLPVFIKEVSGGEITPEERLNMWRPNGDHKIDGDHKIEQLLKEAIIKPIQSICEDKKAEISELFESVISANATNRLTVEDYKKAADGIKGNDVYKKAPKYVKAQMLNGELLETYLKAYVLDNRSQAVIDRDAKDLLKAIEEKKVDQMYMKLKAPFNGSTRSVKELEAEIAKLEDNKKTLEKEFSEKNKLSQENLEAILNTKDQMDLSALIKMPASDINTLAEGFLKARDNLSKQIVGLEKLRDSAKELDKFLSTALAELHAFANLGDVAKKDLPDVKALVKVLESNIKGESNAVKVLESNIKERKKELSGLDTIRQKMNRIVEQLKANKPPVTPKAPSLTPKMLKDIEEKVKAAAAEQALAAAKARREAAAAPKGIFHRLTGTPLSSWF
jgi:hypothetical protein